MLGLCWVRMGHVDLWFPLSNMTASKNKSVPSRQDQAVPWEPHLIWTTMKITLRKPCWCNMISQILLTSTCILYILGTRLICMSYINVAIVGA